MDTMPSKEQKENPPKQKQHQFILHIQGLRTLAIVGVMCSHIWPTIFYGGSLGVDIFFVISGFLMAKILSAAPINLQNILQFYSRRIHRIVPIYLVILICIFTAAQILLTQTDFQLFREDFIWSMLFASNIHYFFLDYDFFGMLFKVLGRVHKNNSAIHGIGTRLLTPMWSLAVEIQFYLLVPFLFVAIFWLAKKWGQNGRGGCCRERTKICAIFLLAIMLPSWALQIGFWQFVDGGVSIAVTMLFCRLWQLAAGIIVFFLSKDNHQSHEKPISLPQIQQNSSPTISSIFPANSLPTSNSNGQTIQQMKQNMFPQNGTIQPKKQKNFPPIIIYSTIPSQSLPAPNSIDGITKQRKNEFQKHFNWTTATPLLLTILLIAIFAMPASLYRIIINALFVGGNSPAEIEFGAPYEMVLRTIVILITVFIIYLLRNNKNGEFSVSSLLLDNPFSVHLGNLSYICYLVHYPLFKLVKNYFCIQEMGIWDGCAILVASIGVSELFDRLVDANFRRIKSKLILIKLIIGLYLFCAILLLPTFHSAHSDENLPTYTNDMFKGKGKAMDVEVANINYSRNGSTIKNATGHI